MLEHLKLSTVKSRSFNEVELLPDKNQSKAVYAHCTADFLWDGGKKKSIIFNIQHFYLIYTHTFWVSFST